MASSLFAGDCWLSQNRQLPRLPLLTTDLQTAQLVLCLRTALPHYDEKETLANGIIATNSPTGNKPSEEK